MQLQNKVVVVTGGGSGIGQQIVLGLLKKGAIVGAADINTDGLQDTQKRAGTLAEKLTLHKTDISDRESVSQLAQEVIKQHGCVDAIVNNAGIIHPFKSFNELDYRIIDRVIKVNLYGVINMIKTFLPLLLERPAAHIVNVSSMGGLFAFPKQTPYGASKAAVKLISEGLYSELRNTQVGITMVCPGAIDTNITKNCDATTEKMEKLREKIKGTSAETVARRIIQSIEKNRFRVHVGIDAKILSVLYRLLPNSTIVLLNKVMQFVLPG